MTNISNEEDIIMIFPLFEMLIICHLILVQKVIYQ